MITNNLKPSDFYQELKNAFDVCQTIANTSIGQSWVHNSSFVLLTDSFDRLLCLCENQDTELETVKTLMASMIKNQIKLNREYEHEKNNLKQEIALLRAIKGLDSLKVLEQENEKKDILIRELKEKNRKKDILIEIFQKPCTTVFKASEVDYCENDLRIVGGMK